MIMMTIVAAAIAEDQIVDGRETLRDIQELVVEVGKPGVEAAAVLLTMMTMMTEDEAALQGPGAQVMVVGGMEIPKAIPKHQNVVGNIARVVEDVPLMMMMTEDAM